MTSSVFDISADSPKAAEALVAADRRHFDEVRRTLAGAVAATERALAAARRSTDVRVGAGVERDLEIRRLERRLRVYERMTVDVCLGRMDPVDGEPRYLGRIGLTADDGRTLLVDWRAPDAEPFFAATLADPNGLRGRRHYRWSRQRIVDYWDEAFTVDGRVEEDAALDSQSAFIRSLGADRSPRMRSVLGTIAVDQDAAIRAPSAGALVVDGGPGTGKTVVALHRAAYLLYADPRLRGGRGSLLVVGPHTPYLAYIADVLPSLGEDGVVTGTTREFVPGGQAAPPESDPRVARLKGTLSMVAAVDAAVAFHEEPPADDVEIETVCGELTVTAADWAEAFDAVEPGVPHNEARPVIREMLVDLLVGAREPGIGADELRAALDGSVELTAAVRRAWPLLDADDVLADLWSVPAYLRRCAPHLSADEVGALRRTAGRAWTTADLPLLDVARRRLGDATADASAQVRRRQTAERRRVMDDVVDDLRASADGEDLVSMLRAEDVQSVIVDETGLADTVPDALAGPFAHIVVDEAQELTDAEWACVLARCPSGSLTIVGDRAQAAAGFLESWTDRLTRVGVRRIRHDTLRINYRTPEEIMTPAALTIRAAVPDANVPTSVRRSGVAVRRGHRDDLAAVVDAWLADHPSGTACVIGAPGRLQRPRVRSLTPALAKGLEFDLVVLVDPAAFGSGVAGAVARYVAMTRATRELVILE